MKGGAENNASSAVSATDLLHGLAKAYERFMSEGRLAVEPVDAYMPIFEALSSATALDGRIANARGWSWRKHVCNGEVVAGLRFARNRAHHQWAAVLHVTLGAALPAPSRIRCSSGVGAVTFRPGETTVAKRSTSITSPTYLRDSHSNGSK
jgi:hypothetical protein